MIPALLSLVLLVFAQDSSNVTTSSTPTPSDGSAVDECAASSLDDYTLNYHVIGLFVILAASFTGTFGTIILGSTYSKLRYQALQIFKMFGIGVIAATAWIHLLPEAFANFTSPCLQGYWTEYGGSYVGLFAMAAAFLVQLIETGSMAHSHQHEVSSMKSAETMKVNDMEINQSSNVCDDDCEDHSSESQISVVFLEAGIIFHSVVIGLNLGVEADSGFTTLMIAIAFHQFFEGMALGALIATTRLSKNSKVVLGIMYPLTTPIGMAIGISVRNIINVNSQALILFQGILGSLSAGILMYNTYCELMSLEINHNTTFKTYTKNFKIACFFSMYLGASALAILGIWA